MGWRAVLANGRTLYQETTPFQILDRTSVQSLEIWCGQERLYHGSCPLTYRKRESSTNDTVCHVLVYGAGLTFVFEPTGKVVRRDRWGAGWFLPFKPVTLLEQGLVVRFTALPVGIL